MTGLAIGEREVATVLVLGFGVTGRALVEYCRDHEVLHFVSEAKRLSARAKAWLSEGGTPFEDGGHTVGSLERADVVVLSPGIPQRHPLVAAAQERGIPVLSELDFAFSLAPSRPIVAVTGTNGKGTTVSLVGEILRWFGLAVSVGGNIGIPFVAIVDEAGQADAIVLEVSSFQLEQSSVFHPRVGVLLNLSPDHLDRHGTMAAYAEAKGRLFRVQTCDDVAVLPRGLGQAFSQGDGVRIFFDVPDPVLPTWSDRLTPHNRVNLAAAVVACRALVPALDPRRIPLEAIRAAFHLPFRIQDVGEIAGVRVVNDSKSTNASATVAALRAVDGPVVLLIGGRHKRAGYEALAGEIAARDVRKTILYGEAAEALHEMLAESSASVQQVGGLDQAVSAGLAAARPGDTLLFSPACSSFDQFSDYAQRGEAFTRAVSARPGFIPHSDKETGRELSGHLSPA
jgi:UDP-N-acetylmuramoylalanine--D-glutamate ligase